MAQVHVEIAALIAARRSEKEVGDRNLTGLFALLTSTGIEGAEHVIAKQNGAGGLEFNVYESATQARKAMLWVVEEHGKMWRQLLSGTYEVKLSEFGGTFR